MTTGTDQHKLAAIPQRRNYLVGYSALRRWVPTSSNVLLRGKIGS